MEKPDQLRELFRMQNALNKRIGVNTESMTEEEKTKWILPITPSAKCNLERKVR